MKKIFTLIALCFYMCALSQQKKIVILGSSSAAGYNVDTSWAMRLALNNYSVTNLAQSTITVETALPTGYSTADTNRNSTRAIALAPDIVVLSYPSNGYDAMSVSDILSNLRIIYSDIKSHGIRCLVGSTQPRNPFSPTERTKLKILKDSIMLIFGEDALDFFTILAQSPNWTYKIIYAQPDGIHPNDSGHFELYKIIDSTLSAPPRSISINAGIDISTYSKNISSQYSITNLKSGTYKVIVSIQDSIGNTISDTISITKMDSVIVISPPPPPQLPPVITTGTIKVNIYGGTNAYNNAGWHNWNVSSSLNSGNLKYSDGIVSSVNAVLSQHNGISENALPYSVTMASYEVIRYTSYSTSANRTLTISGLDSNKTYDLELYASRKGISNNTTRFTIGTSIVNVVTDNNASNKAMFTSLTPVAGKITVSIGRLNTYSYLNGFTLTEKSAVQQLNQQIPEPTLAIATNLLQSYTPKESIDRIIVVDMLGRTVKTIRDSYNSSYMDSLPQGLYTVVFITKKKNYIYRVLK